MEETIVVWTEVDLRNFLRDNIDSEDVVDRLICKTIASSLSIIQDDRQTINELEDELSEYEAKRYYTQCTIEAQDKRIKELEDFLNETQARIRGALRIERP